MFQILFGVACYAHRLLGCRMSGQIYLAIAAKETEMLRVGNVVVMI